LDGASPVTPWALAEIARESIVHGAQQGQAPPSLLGLQRLCALYANLDDPLSETPEASIDQFFVRIGFEQFRWQLSEFEELARPQALFVEAARRVSRVPAHSEERWRAALGCSVDEFVDTGFYLFVWAAQNGGWIDLDLMTMPHFEEVNALHPPELVRLVVDWLLAAGIPQLRAMDGAQVVPGNVQEHRFNPLAARPLVKMRDGRFVVPHPLLILHRLGVSGLYYDRVQEAGFTDQLGSVFEEYVGMHLQLLRGAQVEHAVMAAAGDEVIDYVVVLREVVLLVEVKATRLTELARMGLEQLTTDRDRTLGKAYWQIDRAERLIAEGHPAFSFVPRDRPRRGLVVTLEPYWNALTSFADLPRASISTTVAHIREVELLGAAGLVSDVGSCLLGMTGEHSNNVLHAAVVNLDRVRNPVLDRGWSAALGRITRTDSSAA
jgi:hypothetical protein